MMKVAQLTKYNKQNPILNIVDIPIPQINDNQVLVKIKTAGVNPLDNMISRGEVKLVTPYKLPLTAGNEMVGIIEKVGNSVSQFRVGDRVFARLPLSHIGAFAEYVAVDVNALAKVPDYLSDVEAAAVPLTALIIIQALDLMKIDTGKTIFISGGTGGVGPMAIPIAKAKGLKVITNGALANKERVMDLGVDQFIDYKMDDYTKILKNIDYVLDTLGGSETIKQMNILRKGGHLVSLRAMPNGAFAKRMSFPIWKRILFRLAGLKLDLIANKKGVHYDFIYVKSNGVQLSEVADILSKTRVKPSIDKVFSFEEVNDALNKVANERSRVKTILVFQ